MAAFSIFTRDSESAEDARLDSQESSLLSYRGERCGAVELSSDPAESGSEFESLSPGQIVLRLPDLTDSRSGALRSLIGPQLFWVAVVLGALLATVLIWGAKNPAPPEIDEAPAWNSEAPWRQSAPEKIERAAEYESSQPSVDDRGTPEQAPPEIRAARRVDTPWDGSSQPAMSGVAIPVGTIIMGAPE